MTNQKMLNLEGYYNWIYNMTFNANTISRKWNGDTGLRILDSVFLCCSKMEREAFHRCELLLLLPSVFEGNSQMYRWWSFNLFEDMVDGKQREWEQDSKHYVILTEVLRLSLSFYYLAITWDMVGFLQLLAAGVVKLNIGTHTK